MIFAFDLDGTLCDREEGGYESSTPHVSRIRHVNQLRKDGHKILIYTARGGKSGNDYRELTLTQLEDWGVQFDELVAKPSFDLLVDDKAVTSASYWLVRGL